MKIQTTVRTAMRALKRNPMRALLTTMGIVIGVGAVIAMMEIGTGSSSAIRKTISTMGADVLNLTPGAAAAAGVSYGAGSGATLTPEDCEAILRECPSIRHAAPMVHTRTQVVYGNRNWVPTYIYGTTPAFLDVLAWTVSEGEPFTDRDVLTGNRVCLLGETLARELFQGENPAGKDVRIKNVSFRVVGVLGSKGANMMGMDQDDIVLAPWTAIKHRVAGARLSETNQSASGLSGSVKTLSNPYPGTGPVIYPQRSASQIAASPMQTRLPSVDHILAAAHNEGEMASAMQQITLVLRECHRIQEGEPDDFRIRDMREIIQALTSTATLMTNLLLCVAMISLVVGGVGIMNIMLVSVTERTREIGLRMAVGARARDILWQFLVEAMTLCLAGGMMGILIGHGGSHLVWVFLRWPVEASPIAVAAALIVSGSVGLIFGFYPAWKASRLHPIEALRYE